ncbi:MAG TPA: 2-amino-4-hydroxy-6-hydroxymethyldihydropteridine diphosphokinase [Sphingobacteriaceae bacterium]|nr:2-amino-4-hydroxy-6-hydroxymethyldihydropteridine diphosphokinase [Sphingobacteriaceae bacterium]
MHDIYLLLGSNLGDRKAYLSAARTHIEQQLGKIESMSSLYETASWGKTNEPEYINQVIHLRSDMTAEEVLKIIISIEKQLGRERTEKWGSRIIDIDILFYDDQIINEPDLVIPHPQLHLRRFTLAPLNELIPNFNHPLLEKSINDLYCSLKDNLAVQKIKN